MKHIKHWLATMAVLLCSVTASAATYSDWTSTNKGQSSTSSNTYNITASAGDVLTFDWLVSSESGYDKLIVTIGSTEILNKSGEYSGNYQHTFTSSGNYTMEVKYTKDGSVNNGSDYAKVYNIALKTGSSGSNDSGTDKIVASGTCGESLTWKLSDEGELTIEGTGAMYDYSNGSTPWYNNKTSVTKVTLQNGVTSIGQCAFINCHNLISITIPESVNKIGSAAFYACGNLTDITIPQSVTEIESEVFFACSDLTSIRIPEGVTSIGTYAFFSCSDLSSITIPKSVAKINGRAFYNCLQLSNINIADDGTLIGGEAFHGTQWYEWQPDGVIYLNNVLYAYKGIMPENTSIEVREGTISINPFSGCNNLVSITLPKSVTEIGARTFQNCSSLTTINIPENSQLTSIGDYAYENCRNLTSITIPEGVTSIGYRAFSGCSSLTSINIPEGVTSIRDDTFENCYSLTSITIPEGVTEIGDCTFEGCGLTSIVVKDGNITYDSRNNCNAIIETNSNTLVVGCASTIIPESVTSIGYSAFFGCSSLTSIAIPESVTSIGYSAFSGCSSLTSIAIPESVTEIEFEAFGNCSSLTSITISEGVTGIEDYAFYGCSSLTSITCEVVTPPTIYYDTFCGVDKSIPLYVPNASILAYQSASYWKDFTNIQGISETVTINQYGSATSCSEYALDFSEVEGLKAYAATGFNSSTGVVTLSRVMTAKAGVGLFIKGEPGDYAVPVMEYTDDNTLNMLVGTSETVTLGRTSEDGLYVNYKYTLSGDNPTPQFYVFDDGFTLGAGKAYLQVPAAWVQTEARAISLQFDDRETTDIEEIESTDSGQQSTVIFDLMGRRVENPVKGGVYIVNGKKVVY